FIDLAVTTGLIGVATLVWFLVWCPLRDFHRGEMSGNSPRLGLMYLQVWIFMMLYANLESPFFVTRGPIWFALLTAIIGLRLHAYGSQKQPISTRYASQAVAPGTLIERANACSAPCNMDYRTKIWSREGLRIE